MKKQKILSALSLLGFIFIIALTIGYFHTKKERIAFLPNQITVPNNVSKQFSRVITKNTTQKPTAVNFITPEGKPVTWENFKGEYLLVNFWATWCAPCVLELPSLEKLQSYFKDKNLNVISISLDQRRNHDQIKRFVYNRNIGEFATYFDQNKVIQRKIRMRGIPTTYLLSPEGYILYIFEGDANWANHDVLSFFSNILENKTSKDTP